MADGNQNAGRGVAGGIAALVALGFYFGPKLMTAASPVVTMGQFQSISEGMSVDEVKSIMRSDGELQVSNAMPGYTGEIRMWQNPDGSNMSIQFQNGKVITRAQYGLK